jgi:hypothetical protein
MVLRDSRLKIDRANKHIADIEARIRTLHDSQTSVIEMDQNTGCETLKYEFPDVTAFTDIALMLGDAIHNLNCALDYTWLQTIEKVAPYLIGDRAKFPVGKTVNDVEGLLRKVSVHIKTPALFNFIVRQIQPCDGVGSEIWPAHTLDIRDKHRLLIPVMTTGHIDCLEVEDETGEVFKGPAFSPDFQKPPYYLPFRRGLHIKNKPQLTAQIVIEYEKLGYPPSVPQTIIDYSRYILAVVKLFERFLEAQISS